MLWFYTASSMIHIAILVFAFTFALINRSKCRRATLVLLVGLFCMIISSLIVSVGVPIIYNFYSVSASPNVIGALRSFLSIISSFGIALIVIAVYVDREKKPAIIERYETVTIGTSDNPYQVSQPTQN